MNIPEIFLFDMDGTLYLGDRIIEGAPAFIEKLRAHNIITVFFSNNSSKNRNEYVDKLNRMHIPAVKDDIFTSLNASILYMQNEGIKRIYALGTPAFEDELNENGFVLTDNNPEAVLLGFDKTLTYEKIDKAYQFIIQGKRYIATHPDILCPTETGFIPDIGSFISMFHTLTGMMPEIIGKPNVEMVNTVLSKHKKSRKQCAMVGDRLYTDMKMAVDADILSILVLSGETDMDMYRESGMKVDIVTESVSKLIEYFEL